MKRIFRFLLALTLLGVTGAIAAVSLVAGAYVYLEPSLPESHDLENVRLQIPLSIYTSDGLLIAQYGEDWRTPVAMEDIPELVVRAFLAAEDERFFEHLGFDWRGSARAVYRYLTTGTTDYGGGSTITQQVARHFYLSTEETLARKAREIFLAYRIEQEVDKEKILEIYLNMIFLGHRANGVATAARVYFDKNLDELTLAEIATLAGATNAPSLYNPVSSPRNSAVRRGYVLGRMLDAGFIDRPAYEEAMAETVVAQVHGPRTELSAPYIAEMARQEMMARFGSEALTAGFHVYTTVDSQLQQANDDALRRALLDYDRRHGWRGPVERLGAQALVPPADGALDEHYQGLLRDYRAYPLLWPAVVLNTQEQTAQVYVSGSGSVTLPWSGISWARTHINENSLGPALQQASEVLQAGDVVYVTHDGEEWLLAQIPQVQGALVSMDPLNGAIQSLSGGYDYFLSSFNRATQAQRQPGSAFKPFIYSAALEQGFNPASIIIDGPQVYDSGDLSPDYRPSNYTNTWYGPTPLREALARSLNGVAVQVLQRTGLGNTINHLRPFGFRDVTLPRDLTMALGSGSVTPLEMTRGYAVFANGGYRVDPYLIERVEDGFGNVLYQADPASLPCAYCDPLTAAPLTAGVAQTADGLQPAAAVSGSPAPAGGAQTAAPVPERVISATNAWILNDMMTSVIQPGHGGTAVRAWNALQRTDLAGKTGTSNLERDAWFVGYNSQLVATAWVGFDQGGLLGVSETGGGTALPMWIDFMGTALDGVPQESPPPPAGIVEARINPRTGLVTSAASAGSVFEVFEVGRVPATETGSSSSSNLGSTPTPEQPQYDTRGIF